DGRPTGPFRMGPEALAAFEALKRRFTEAPILRHYDLALRVKLETDASGYAVSGILSQLFGADSAARWHPIAFFSKKIAPVQLRYDTYDKELMAIVLSMEHWGHYLRGAAVTIGRVVVKFLPGLYFKIEPPLALEAAPLRDGTDPLLAAVQGPNEGCEGLRQPQPAGPSRPAHMQESWAKTNRNEVGGVPRLKPVTSAIVYRLYVPRKRTVLVLANETAYDPASAPIHKLIGDLQRKDAFVTGRRYESGMIHGRTAGSLGQDWKLGDNGLLRKGVALYVPNSPALRDEILTSCHDDLYAGHFGFAYDWAAKLALAEFSYNNSIHDTTGKPPFYLLYGYVPTIDVKDTAYEGGDVTTAQERVEKLQAERKEIADTLRKATDAYKNRKEYQTATPELEARRQIPRAIPGKTGSQKPLVGVPASTPASLLDP
ncbi:hypothetical protein V493_00754, partial [Pseudogymnoascus sp. VKM F-4281 (FW-2241)]